MNYMVDPVKTNEDEVAFINLLNSNLFDDGSAESKVKWFYKDSPIPGEMFLLKTENGDPVGTKGYGFRYFSYQGTKLLGAISVDISVSKEHRKLKPALVLNQQSAQMLCTNVDFHYTFPNGNSDSLFKRKQSNFQKLGQFVRYWKVLDARSVLIEKLGSRSGIKFVAPFIGIGWKIVLPFTHRSSRNTLRTDKKELCIPALNSQFFSPQKDAQYLKWRFFDNPFHDYKMLHVKRGDVEGVVFYFIKNNKAHISDLVYDTQNPNHLLWILSEFEKNAIESGCNAVVISCIADENHDRLFKRMLYKPHSLGGNVWISRDLKFSTFGCTIFTGDSDTA